MSARLPSPARHLLDNLLRLADHDGVPAYLVGGPLRDLLLDHPLLDLDIAVEGDAIALARELTDSLARRDAPKARLGPAGAASTPRSARPEALVGRAAATTSEMRVISHPTFLTATVRTAGFHLDLITARSETYARPGALPVVKPASIHDDLLRRDFTINALALRLNGPSRGEILDPAGGLRDLDAKLIRALHDRSFPDDATRILRAVRYAARLGFEIESETLRWLKRDLRYLQTISASRLHHEFSRILMEEAPEKALRALHDNGALAAIHPALRFEREHAEAFARLRDLNPTGARAAYWPVLARRLTEADVVGVARRLALTKRQRAAVEAMPALRDLEATLTEHPSRRDASARRLGVEGGRTTTRPPRKRSAVVDLLSPFPVPALWALAALTDHRTIRDRLLDYLTKARHERPHLTGDDLIALGVPSGPALGDILRRLRNARLDGEMRSKGDELRLVKDAARRGGFQTRPPQRPAEALTPLPAHPESLP